MGYNDKYILNKNNGNFNPTINNGIIRSIYYGEVISIDDETETGKIRVRIHELDNKISNSNLPECYPLQQSHIYIMPKVGEAVRIFLEDVRYPYKGRLWLGSIISQQNKLEYEPYMSGLSGTNVAIFKPDNAPSTFPDSKGVFPEKHEIGILGRKNNDIILGDNNLKIRVGKHEIDNPLKLNKINPSVINLNLSDKTSKTSIISSSDKIALLSTDGTIKYNVSMIDDETIENIFNTAHPMVRGDILVEILKVLKNAILNHIHPYDAMPATKTETILKVDNVNFDKVLQKNIVIN